MRRSIRDDDHAASEVVAVALLIAVVVLGVAAIVLVGGSELAGNKDEVEVRQAEQALIQFDSEAERVATGSTSSQQIDLGLKGNSGTLDVEPESGNITIEYRDNLYDTNRTEIVNGSMGTVAYENGDTSVGYQGGGVWRSDGDGSTMVSPPEISFENDTLTMPVVQTERGGSVHSDARISGGPTEQRFPDPSTGQQNMTNKVDSGTVWITIESRYYRAWAQYFEEETKGNADVYPGMPEEGYVTIIFYGSKMNFAPDAGIIATSGPGEIRIEGSGSYIDSYNSTNGSYDTTVSNEGVVRSAGDIDMFGGSEIRGDAHSNKQILLDGTSEIYGDACANGGTVDPDGDGTVGGDTNCTANVPILPPIDSYVEAKAKEVKSENDNDETDLIDDERLNSSATDDELTPGRYYLEKIELEEGETLVLNATAGDMTVVVEDYVVLDEGNIEVKGDVDDGTVQMFVASEDGSGITVPGTGGYVADYFYVDGDSTIRVKNDSSTRFQVLAPARFTGAVRASGSDDPQVTATIIAPTLGDGSQDGKFLLRDGELFGAVVTGNFTAENNAQVHFDRAVMGEKIPFGEGVSLLDYLYVMEHEIEVKGP